MLESRYFAEKMQTTFRNIFGFLDQFVFLPSERSGVPVSNYQLNAWLPLRVTFKSPVVEAPCTVPICLHSCIAGLILSLQLWIAGGGTLANISNGSLSSKARRGPWSLAWRPMRDFFLEFCAFCGTSSPNCTAGQTCPAITQHLLRYQGVPREGVGVGIFVQERPCIEFTASAVMQQSLHVKRRSYVFRYHVSLWDSVNDVFGPFSVTTSTILLRSRVLILFRATSWQSRGPQELGLQKQWMLERPLILLLFSMRTSLLQPQLK